MNATNLDEFDEAMKTASEAYRRMKSQATRTDRDDILAYLYTVCKENVDLLEEGIDLSREDTTVDAERMATLVWLFYDFQDLAHYCFSKALSL